MCLRSSHPSLHPVLHPKKRRFAQAGYKQPIPAADKCYILYYSKFSILFQQKSSQTESSVWLIDGWLLPLPPLPTISKLDRRHEARLRKRDTEVKHGVRSPKFVRAPCAQLYSLAETPQPPPPLIWTRIRGRNWSAKIDDISSWPLGETTCWRVMGCRGQIIRRPENLDLFKFFYNLWTINSLPADKRQNIKIVHDVKSRTIRPLVALHRISAYLLRGGPVATEERLYNKFARTHSL